MNTKYLIECANILKDLDTEEPSHQEAINICEGYLHHAYELYREDCINYNMDAVSEKQFFLELMSLDEGVVRKIVKGVAAAGAVAGAGALAAKTDQTIKNQQKIMQDKNPNGEKVTYGQAAKAMFNSNKAEGAGGFKQNVKAALNTGKQIMTTNAHIKDKLSSAKQGFSNGGGFKGAKDSLTQEREKVAQNGGAEKLQKSQQENVKKSQELQNTQVEKQQNNINQYNNKLNMAKQNLEKAKASGDENSIKNAEKEVTKYNNEIDKSNKKMQTYDKRLAPEAKGAQNNNVQAETSSLNMLPIDKVSFYSSMK